MANLLESQPEQKTEFGCSRVPFFFFAVLVPIAALVVELATRMCAESFFDPIPTFVNGLLIALVPISNFVLYRALHEDSLVGPKAYIFFNGMALGTSFYYTILFIPLSVLGLIAILGGIGLLPLAPAFSLLGAFSCFRLLKKRLPKMSFKALLAGVGTSLLLLFAVEMPQFLTQLAMQRALDGSQRSLTFLRTVGDEDYVLSSCYMGPRTGLMLLGSALNIGGRHVGPTEARELYYRMTGTSFSQLPVPEDVRSFLVRGGFDVEQGGETVGGRLKHVKMETSQMLCSVEPEAKLAYLEWTFVFRNDHVSRNAEARTQLLLPPGAVVSRATLWVNGKEKEAAFATRAKAREAYESVVRQNMDPLLVTTYGPDRALVQCFPISPGGGKMRIRIGMTVPIQLTSETEGVMPLPRLLEQNFGMEAGHEFKVVSGKVSGSSFEISDGQAALEPGDFINPAVYLKIEGLIASQVVNFPLEEGFVVGRVDKETRTMPTDPIFVVDGSSFVAQYLDQLTGAIPDSAKVVFAGDEVEEISGAELANRTFVGGQDSAEALRKAFTLAGDNGVVVWIHGGQPVELSSLEWLKTDLKKYPSLRLFDFPLECTANRVVESLDGFSQAESALRLGSVKDDLRKLLDPGVRLTMRVSRESTGDGVEVDKHLARLWAAQESKKLWANGDEEKAALLAVEYQLVTPASGAVVLETQEQYDEAGLEPVDAGTVPSIPEPEVWLLLVVMLLCGGFALRRKREAV